MFTEKAKLTALAIVHIFETSKPFGDYSTCVVLNDDAGITYGINQFTHKSGSLLAVCLKYLEKGGTVGADVINGKMSSLKNIGTRNTLAQNEGFKSALRAAGKTAEMQEAQNEVSIEKYLNPALEACEGSNFILPMSLAVIFDSINHGSWAKIRDKVTTPDSNEKGWITEYVRDRDHWLESVPRLKPTAYRTDFFLAQIARGNWQLDLPMNVHGFNLTSAQIKISTAPTPPATNEQGNNQTPSLLPTGKAVDTIQGEGGENSTDANETQNVSTVQTTLEHSDDTLKATTTETSTPKVVQAPGADGSTATVTKATIYGVVVPGFVLTAIKVISDAIEKGFIKADELGSTALTFVSQNFKWVALSVVALIVFLALKKVLIHIGFFLEMFFNASKNHNDIKVETK